MLARIIEILYSILPLIQELRGSDNGTGNRVTEILYQCRLIWRTVTDNSTRLQWLQADMTAALAKLDTILSLIPWSGVPTAPAVASEVWGYLLQPSYRSAEVALGSVYAHGDAVQSQFGWRYLGTPLVRVLGGPTGGNSMTVPDDLPALDTTTIRPLDTLLAWLQRSAPALTWTPYFQGAADGYIARSEDDNRWLYGCELTAMQFEQLRQTAGRSGTTETSEEAGITDSWTLASTALVYRVHLSAIPTWAGYRIGSPPLYEVNSRSHQLGWAMFGTADGWYDWTLLTWGDQIVTCPGHRATRFHLELREGVVAEVLRVGA